MSKVGMIQTVIATEISEAIELDGRPGEGGYDLNAGLFGKNMSDWIRKMADVVAREPNPWIPADQLPLVIMHPCGRYGRSKVYPVLTRGFKDPVLAELYQAPNGEKIWVVFDIGGRSREVVYYYDLPAAPSDHEATN